MLFPTLLALLLLPLSSLAAHKAPWAAPQAQARAKPVARWGQQQEASTFRPRSQRVPMQPRVSSIPTVWDRSYANSTDYVVRAGTTNATEYATIQAAVDAVLADVRKAIAVRIFVYAGVYNEQVFSKNQKAVLTIQGETSDAHDYTNNLVTITGRLDAYTATSNDLSATFRASQANLRLYNLNIENTFGHTAPGCACQAIALSTQGTNGQQGFYGLKVSGYQDTLLANKGTQIFARSAIEGAVDFIFGAYAPTYIFNSDIVSISAGAITAPGGATEEPTTADAGQMIVIDSSRIILSSDAATNATGGTYLGRPWKPYGKAVYLRSHIGGHVNKAGWQAWSSSTLNTNDSVMAEYDTTGPGSYGANAASRVSWGQDFSTTDAQAYTIDKVLGSNYTAWVDASFLN